MNYNGIDCPVCSNKFDGTADIVVCPVCGTPHHRHCWHENGRCINEEKHNEGFIWQMMNEAPASFKNHENDMKVCPRCGENNAAYEPVCIRCGERLRNQWVHSENHPSIPQIPRFNGNWQAEVNPNTFSPYQNVYAQDAKTVYGDNTKIEDIPVGEVAEYIQKDSNKYIGKMLEMQEKETKLSWNWASALGSFFWCFYRKMAGLGTILLCIYLTVSFAAGIIIPLICNITNPEIYNEYIAVATQLNDLISQTVENGATSIPAEYYELLWKLASSPLMIASRIVSIATALIISIVTGFLGTYFYKKKVLKDIRTLRQVSVNSVSYHMYLRHRGGTSPVNLLIPIMIYFMYSMFTSFL